MNRYSLPINSPHKDCFGHKLVVEVVDIEVNNSVGVVDKGMHDIVVVRIGQIDRLVDHTLEDEEVDKIDSVEHHLMTPYMMDLYCNLKIIKLINLN